MPTRQESIFRMRDMLDNPYPSSPSFHKLLRQQISEEIDIVNSLNNSSQPWCVGEYQLNFNPAQSVYTINATDFGKPLFMTRATGNPFIPQVPVPFTDLNALQYGTIWNAFYNFYNGWGGYNLPTTIEQAAFSRTGATNQEFKVTFQPMPQTTAVYTIIYLIGYFGSDDPLSTASALPEFATMTQLRGSLALLPYCQWSDDRSKDLERKQELRDAFLYQLSRKEQDFLAYKRNLVHPRIVEIEPWAYLS